MVGWLCFMSHQQQGHLETTPSFTVPCMDMKLGKYTVPTGNRTLARRIAVHYITVAPRKLQCLNIMVKIHKPKGRMDNQFFDLYVDLN